MASKLRAHSESGMNRSDDQLLTVEEAAERLNTGARFVRRLIAERRIEFVHVGRHVRIAESALADFVDAGRVLAVHSARDPW